ncbi:MAG: TIGR02678 family protein [Eubacteriales bacterium]
MNALEVLLEKRWILKQREKDLYYEIKDECLKYKNFIQEKLGYKLIINPYMIKLEKIPGKAEGWMGLRDFKTTMEYIFLCYILVFLEDHSAEEQFILSEITDFLEAQYPDKDVIDWTLYQQRRSLIKVLNFCEEEGLIRTNDGDEKQFAEELTAEVLYENTGISKYFMRRFHFNIMDINDYKAFEEREWFDLETDRGTVRRNRVYRRLIMSPAVNRDTQNEEEDQDYLYIKKYHHIIENDLEKYFNSALHIHKTSAYMLLKEDSQFRDVFPNKKNISDIILQLNKIIYEQIKTEEIIPKVNDLINISKIKFAKLVQKCINENQIGWSKLYREASFDKIVNEIIEYMSSFQMMKYDKYNEEVTIYPIIGKINGKYPQEYLDQITQEEG